MRLFRRGGPFFVEKRDILFIKKQSNASGQDLIRLPLRASTFPYGEGGTALAVTDEVFGRSRRGLSRFAKV